MSTYLFSSESVFFFSPSCSTCDGGAGCDRISDVAHSKRPVDTHFESLKSI